MNTQRATLTAKIHF